MTIKEALDVQKRTISSREAEIFLQESLNKERTWLFSHPEYNLSPEEEGQYLSFINQRNLNLPVAYVIGHKEFYGRRFHTDKRALIPRPETEKLIDMALAWLPDYFRLHLSASNKPCPVHILELGTGCGNIATTLALELGTKNIPTTIVATDISSEALELAKENHATLNPTPHPLIKTHFIQADLFQSELIANQKPFHLIIANLPYVPTTWQSDPAAQPEVVFHEPDVALFGGEDGLSIYRRFFAEVPGFLHPEGRILIEFGEDETQAITPLATQALPNHRLTIYQDYAGLDRVLELKSAH